MASERGRGQTESRNTFGVNVYVALSYLVFFFMRSLHDGDGAVCEVDDLLGNRSKEMRVETGQAARTDH